MKSSVCASTFVIALFLASPAAGIGPTAVDPTEAPAGTPTPTQSGTSLPTYPMDAALQADYLWYYWWFSGDQRGLLPVDPGTDPIREGPLPSSNKSTALWGIDPFGAEWLCSTDGSCVVERGAAAGPSFGGYFLGGQSGTELVVWDHTGDWRYELSGDTPRLL